MVINACLSLRMSAFERPVNVRLNCDLMFNTVKCSAFDGSLNLHV